MAAAMTVSLAACSKGQTDAALVASTAAAETETTTAANAAANSTYTGTVTAVSASSLTLSTESDGDITVPLTDATTYTRGGMGGGQAPDSNPPEQPSGDNGGTPPELPADGAGQGSAPADGQAPDASGQQPQGGAPDANGSAPEKPADDAQGTDSPDGSQSADAPEKPDGSVPDGQPDGEAEALTYESISVGDTVTVTVGDDGSAATVELAGGMGGPGGGMDGGSSKPESYDAATEFTADDTRDGAAYASTGTDENSGCHPDKCRHHPRQCGQHGRRHFQLLRRRRGGAGHRRHAENLRLHHLHRRQGRRGRLCLRRRHSLRQRHDDRHEAGHLRRHPCGGRRHTVRLGPECGDKR